MTDRLREARRLEQLAAHEASLERAQMLALEADRLRKAADTHKFFYSVLPLLRS